MILKQRQMHQPALRQVYCFLRRSGILMTSLLSALAFSALVPSPLQGQMMEGEEAPVSFEWRAVSLDFKARYQPGEDPVRGYIHDVHVDGVEDAIQIPFARPTTSAYLSRSPEIVFYRPSEVIGEAPTILAQKRLSPEYERVLLFFWPNNQQNGPLYRLLAFPDVTPRPGKRLAYLINFTPDDLYISFEGQRMLLPSLQPDLVTCRDSAEERSEFIIFRGPEGDIPARRLVATSYRINQGELATILILPKSGTRTPSLQVFRDWASGAVQ